MLVEALGCIAYFWSEEQYIVVLAQRPTILDGIQEIVHCSCFSRLVLILQDLQLYIDPGPTHWSMVPLWTFCFTEKLDTLVCLGS